jgi:hypothetical protein
MTLSAGLEIMRRKLGRTLPDPRNKAMNVSPWLKKEQTSCELEYNSEQDGVAGMSG